ncbi:prepilin peptidase [Bacillus changyiensis]|uniref:prepilin peptidase n=1 Tax=Bacillus changyiensis TaxID=3004103 RepID=UPI0022E15A21|nr:A24 family peptidase [Bacillus changyiensis]MDA1477451.1 A24 family peptidase [Bacillus changyiensis]
MIYLFIAGAVLGSFFHIAGRRIPKKISLFIPRSSCPICLHKRTFLELIPILSYLFCRGKCKQCKSAVSLAIELGTAMLFVQAYTCFDQEGERFIALLLISLLMIVFVSDVMYMVIPNVVLCFFLPFLILVRIFVPLDPWHSSLTGAVCGCLLPLFTAIFTKGGIGGGDIKLFTVLGLVLGYRLVLLAFFLSATIGTVFALIAMFAGQLNRREPLPFVPAISIGTLLSYFYGEHLINLYRQFAFG